MDKYLALFQDGLFKGLAPDEAEAFLSRCHQMTYKDGTRLFEELSEADKLYLPVSGSIRLCFKMPSKKGEATLVTRMPGEAVGWSSVVPPHHYQFSGVCCGETTVFVIDRQSMQTLFSTNYHFAYIFMRNIAVLAVDRMIRLRDNLAKIIGDEAVTGW